MATSRTQMLLAENLLDGSPVLAQIDQMKIKLVEIPKEYKVTSFSEYFTQLQEEIGDIGSLELQDVLPPGQEYYYLASLSQTYENVVDDIERLHVKSVFFSSKVKSVIRRIDNLSAVFTAWYQVALSEVIAEDRAFKLPAGVIKGLAESEFSRVMDNLDVDLEGIAEALDSYIDILKSQKKFTTEKYNLGKDQVNAMIADRVSTGAGVGANPQGYRTLDAKYGGQFKKNIDGDDEPSSEVVTPRKTKVVVDKIDLDGEEDGSPYTSIKKEPVEPVVRTEKSETVKRLDPAPASIVAEAVTQEQAQDIIESFKTDDAPVVTERGETRTMSDDFLGTVTVGNGDVVKLDEADHDTDVRVLRGSKKDKPVVDGDDEEVPEVKPKKQRQTLDDDDDDVTMTSRSRHDKQEELRKSQEEAAAAATPEGDEESVLDLFRGNISSRRKKNGGTAPALVVDVATYSGTKNEDKKEEKTAKSSEPEHNEDEVEIPRKSPKPQVDGDDDDII